MLSGESAVIPSVAGQTPEQAKALLESLNFVYAPGAYQVDSALPAGQVAETDPSIGSKVPVGSTVIVYTSNASLLTTMPNVIGKSRHQATQMIVSSGFDQNNITVKWVASAQPAGGGGGGGLLGDYCTVLSSTPGANTSTSKTSAVTLNISTGKPAGDSDATNPPSGPGPGCNP
jgi:serine/threonine-protein kinase